MCSSSATLRYDINFRFAPLFGGQRASALNSNSNSTSTSTSNNTKQPEVQITKVDWKQQAGELEEMFEQQCKTQLQNLSIIKGLGKVF